VVVSPSQFRLIGSQGTVVQLFIPRYLVRKISDLMVLHNEVKTSAAGFYLCL